MNMKTIRYAIIFVTLVINHSCKKKYSYESKYAIKKIKEIEFPLDSFSKVSYSQFIAKKRKIIMLNRVNNSLYMYDYDNKKIDSIISYKSDYRIGLIDGFIAKNMDSVFLYSYNNAELYLTNLKKEIKKKYSFYDRTKDKLLPLIDNQNKAFIEGDYFYLTNRGSTKAFKKNSSFPKTTVSILDLKTGEFNFKLAYSDVYKNKVWSSQQYNLSSTYNPYTKDKIYSFLIDEKITVLDSLGNYKEYYAGSDFITEVNPYSWREAPPISPKEEVDFLFSNPYFANIYYDPYSKLYFRFAFIPLLEKDETKKMIYNEIVYNKQYSVIILDENFNKKGEVKLPHFRYDVFNVFFTEEGMHILNKDSGENEMKYDIYKIVKK